MIPFHMTRGAGFLIEGKYVKRKVIKEDGHILWRHFPSLIHTGEKPESPIIGDLIKSPSAGDQSEYFDSLQFVVIITRFE